MAQVLLDDTIYLYELVDRLYIYQFAEADCWRSIIPHPAPLVLYKMVLVPLSGVLDVSSISLKMENSMSAVAAIVNASDPDHHVQKVIDSAERELRQLIEERVEVTKRICTVKQIIIGLANLYGDVILDDALSGLLGRDGGARQPGITRACRQVLLTTGRPMSAREICDEIQHSVPVLLARHKDPMATIYTILSRLVEYGEVSVLPGGRGQRTWNWAGDRNGESNAPPAINAFSGI